MQKSIKTSVSQPPRSIKNTEQRPRLEIISLWLCGADCEDWVCSEDEESQSPFPSSCPSLLLLGKQSCWATNWVTYMMGNQASYHKLANTPPPWQTEQLQAANWVSYWATRQAITSWQTQVARHSSLANRATGQPGKLSQVGKLIKWQHTGSHAGKLGNQASTMYHRLANSGQ